QDERLTRRDIHKQEEGLIEAGRCCRWSIAQRQQRNPQERHERPETGTARGRCGAHPRRLTLVEKEIRLGGFDLFLWFVRSAELDGAIPEADGEQRAVCA